MEEDQLTRDVKKLRESLPQLPEPVVKPPFIVVSGLPGTGKSYLCHRLAERIPLVILESDALRRLLFPSPTYTPEESSRLFRACHFLIEELLRKGTPLVLDATNLEERHREHLYHIAEQVGAKLVLVWVKAPPQVVRQRLEERGRKVIKENSSAADWGVYQRMKAKAERIRRNYITVDTSKDISSAIDKILRGVNR